MSSSNPNDLKKNQLELDHLRLVNEKLALEIQVLSSPSGGARPFDRFLPLLTALVAVGGFLFGIYQFTTQRHDAEKDRLQNELKAAGERVNQQEALARSYQFEITREH